MRNKFKFIQAFLENEKLNHSQKERFIKLVSKELESASENELQILERINEIDNLKKDIGNSNLNIKKYNEEVNGVKNEIYRIKKNIKNQKIINEDIYLNLHQIKKQNSENENKNSNSVLKTKDDARLNDESNQKITKKISKTVCLKHKNLPDYINPKYLKDFLVEYNQNPILKYTCHTIDDHERLTRIIDECKTQGYEYTEHIKLIHKTYKKLSYKYKDKILKNITGLISRYLGTYKEDEGWSENINTNWVSEELRSWCEKNPGKVPNPGDGIGQNESFGFETLELKNGSTISNFSDLVIYFKHLFHIKSENKLKDIIESVIFLKFGNEEDYSFKFDDEFSDTIDLFTYVETLSQAFSKIISMSKKFHKCTPLNVKLYFGYDENNIKEFKIVILNSSVFGKDFVNFRHGDTFPELIKSQINGLCDLYVKAFFKDKKSVGLVNFWNGKEMVFDPSNKKIEGVEFILKMY